MKILVTGGAGFIGSHVVDAYLEAGYKVIVLDDLSTGSPDNINPEAKFYLMDVASSEVKKLLELERPDVVNHHAAQISVPLSVKDPNLDAKINVVGTVNLLKASVEAGVKKFIFISTGGAIYGETDRIPSDEETPPNPASPYALSKLCGEHYVKLFYLLHKLNYVILRYGNVYGPRQIPHGEAGVVSIFIEKLLAGEKIFVYAYPDEPEGMIRDYVYVKDVARANLLALEKGDREIFNIGTGIGTRTLELLQKVFQAAGKKAPYEIGPPRPGDLRKSILNTEKARHLLGWQPQYSLEEGIKETYDYFYSRWKSQQQ